MAAPRTRIMIVDADAEHGANLARALRERNYEVATTRSCDEVLRSAAEGKFDLVLTDHSHPEIDGIELTRKVKSTGRDLKVVFFSDALDLDMYIKEMNCGAEDCLEKPCKPEEVLRVIETSLRRKVDGQSGTQ